MVNDADHKDDEERDLDSVGQEGVHLTLDQVLILAFQYVRNNREIYGRYADIDLVWALERADETEDYYDIRLSYRPVRDFRGRPGVEQFIIPKSGGVEFRQIISEPHPVRLSPLLLTVMGSLLLVGVAVGGLFAAGVLPPRPSSTFTAEQIGVELTPDLPGRLQSPNGSVVVDIPAGSVTGSAQLNYRALSLAEIPVLPASYRPTKIFDLTSDAPLLKPITITVEISVSDARLAENIQENIVIQHHRDGAWVLLDTKVDFGASTATVQVDHLSIFALTVKEPAPVSTPSSTPTGEGISAPSQLPVSPEALERSAFPTGVEYYRDGQFQSAIDEFTVAINLEPNVRDYYWYRGLSFVGLANYPKAIDDYTAAIALDPGNSTLHALRGSAYSQDGQPEQALLDLDRAISLNPNHAMAYYHRGGAYAELGQDQKAKSDYDKACRLDIQFCE